MEIEYEATFPNIDKDKVREMLKKAGATLMRPEFMQKRVVFNIPKGHEIPGAWLRVRDEGDKITLSLKIVNGTKIEDQKEICIKVDDFEETAQLLATLGCDKKAYQESKRELWMLDNVEITIDEWPFLEPFVEIEGKSEEEVMKVAQKINFDYSKALFCDASTLYKNKYKISEDRINNHTPLITFKGENPFL